MTAYMTSLGKFLPGPPVDNESMEDFLGKIAGKASRARQRVLKQNGILTRHYAIDRDQRSLFSNAEMAALAVREAIDRAGLDIADLDFLAAATSQGDFPLPGFASMVHGELKAPPCEIATLHGVCASGVMALKSALLQVQAGGKRHAVACASEFASRLLKSSRFEAQQRVLNEGLGFDAEFLRWMLSDGAGAAVLQDSTGHAPLCFEVEWIELKSFANAFEPCMYVGPAKNGTRMQSWLDYPTYQSAADDGAINLRQDIRMLDEVMRQAVQELVRLAEARQFRPDSIDWLAAPLLIAPLSRPELRTGRPARLRPPARALVHESLQDRQRGLGVDLPAPRRTARVRIARAGPARPVHRAGERPLSVRLHAAEGRRRHEGAARREAGRRARCLGASPRCSEPAATRSRSRFFKGWPWSGSSSRSGSAPCPSWRNSTRVA